MLFLKELVKACKARIREDKRMVVALTLWFVDCAKDRKSHTQQQQQQQ